MILFVHNDNSIQIPLILLSEGIASAAGQCSILVTNSKGIQPCYFSLSMKSKPATGAQNLLFLINTSMVMHMC